MTLKDYFSNLQNQRLELVNRLSTATGKCKRTVKYYLDGTIVPDKPTRAIIASEIGISEEELFPLKNMNNEI